MAQTRTQSTASPADQKKLWLDQEIWPEIHAMMHNDGYFRLWLKAHDAAGTPYGPIAQMVINGYATYQVAAVRRLCDRSKNVISLPKLLNLIRNEQPCRRAVVASLTSRIEKECEELYTLATQYIAHNGNPAAPDWRQWNLTSAKITVAQKAICEVAIIIERDLLALTQRTHLIPVPQFDYLAEVKALVPNDKQNSLRDFWHAHNDSINTWVHVVAVT
jgi:hypothetical protein